MRKSSRSLGFVTLIAISVIAAALTSIIIPLKLQSSHAIKDGTTNTMIYSGARASIAVSDNNIYLTWWDNKTGNNEVFFAASNDGGKTFDKEINFK